MHGYTRISPEKPRQRVCMVIMAVAQHDIGNRRKIRAQKIRIREQHLPARIQQKGFCHAGSRNLQQYGETVFRRKRR